MDAIPSNRPTASDICNKLTVWNTILNNNSTEDKNESTILKAFQSADMIIPTLSTELPICPKDKLTNTSRLSISLASSLASDIIELARLKSPLGYFV
ncbi:15561_t:CDS:2 [Racocetra persica]|uniref:15561_t:CDS:1 n=1 Tax=Racocetra persica TaxID=160502 RepID=A0ACA9MDM5_9GLOM|nr:15561_t:CDS:2 [Racocetra persica]